MLLRKRRWPADVVETALNRTIGGVHEVYNQSEYAGQRREMPWLWGKYVGGLGKGELMNRNRP